MLTTAACIAEVAIGLLSSMPIMTLSAPNKNCAMAMPFTISSARSRINMSSQVIYGSHSAALITSVWTPLLPSARSLICVGNVAPPKPTIPDKRKLATRFFLSALRQSCGVRSIQVSAPSGVMVMQRSGKPEGCGIIASSMAVTVPEVGA